MNQKVKSCISLFLLFCLCIAIIPSEAFHEHEESSVVCDESQAHYADHATDCDLADFVFPTTFKSVTESPKAYDSLLTELEVYSQIAVDFSKFLSLRSRAPPALA